MIRLSVLAVVCAMCVLPLHARLHAPLEAHVREGLLSEAAWPVDVSGECCVTRHVQCDLSL